MIRVTPKNKDSRTYPDAALENICLVYAGGGATQAQTIKAMLLANNVREKGIVKTRVVTIERVEV
jgi:hypothetical protein